MSGLKNQFVESINDDKIQITGNSLNKSLRQAVIDGDLSAGSLTPDVVASQNFNNAKLADFEVVGATLITSGVLNGKQSAQIIHDSTVTRYIKQVLPVGLKFRNTPKTFAMSIVSGATSGNVSVTLRDETNSVDIITQQIAGTLSTASTQDFDFIIPAGCLSMSYKISGLPQTGLPATIIDDIIIKDAVSAAVNLPVTILDKAAGEIVQVKETSIQGQSTITTAIIPIDDTTPQISEGTQIMALTFTPKYANSYLVIEANVLAYEATNVTNGMALAIFDGNTNAIVSQAGENPGGQNIDGGRFIISHRRDVTSLDPINFTMRIGTRVSTNIVLNKGNDANAAYYNLGNTITSNFKITEIKVGDSFKEVAIPVAQPALIQEGDSSLRLSGDNGQGSVATQFQRFLNIAESVGSNILYTDSPTLGAQFKVAVPGIYNITFSTRKNSAAGVRESASAIFLNNAYLSVGQNIMPTSSSDFMWTTASVSLNLKPSDVINVGSQNPRVYTDVNFSMTYQGSLKQVNTRPNQKITIPTHELRFDGATAKGTTNTNIVKFTSLTSIRGDAFQVNNDAALGTYVTMLKAGKLEASASIQSSVASEFYITKNQTTFTGSSINGILNGAYTPGANDLLSVACSTMVQVGDVIRVSVNASSIAGGAQQFSLLLQEQDVQVGVSNTLPQFSQSDSSIRLNTFAGGGTTGTAIVRFGSLVEYIGTAIQYVASAVNGDSFIALEAGTYDINAVCDNSAGSINVMGLSLNASSTSASIFSLAHPQILAMSDSAATGGIVKSVAWSGYLPAGSIIRVHMGSGIGTYDGNMFNFSMARQGKPNVTGVDITPFVSTEQLSFGDARWSGWNGNSSGGWQLFDTIDKMNGGTVFTSDTTDGHGVRFLRKSNVNVSFMRNSAVLSNNVIDISIYLDGVLVANNRAGNGGSGTTDGVTATYSGIVEAGQVIKFISTATAPAYGDLYCRANLSASAIINTVTIADTGKVGEIIWTPSATAPAGFIPANNKTIGSTASVALYKGETYFTLYSMLWGVPGLSTTVGDPFVISAAKGATARADFDANKTIAIDFATNELFVRQGGTGRVLGSYQASDNLAHSHTTGKIGWGAGPTDNGSGRTDPNSPANAWINGTGTTGGAEARPKNVALNAYIRFSAEIQIYNISPTFPMIAEVLWEVPAATNGGTNVGNAWTQGILNTLNDPDKIGVTLAANQFTLPAGDYYLEGYKCFHSTQYSSARIRNVTDSTTAARGPTVYASPNSIGDGSAVPQFYGRVTLTTPKTFQMEYLTQVVRATYGLGTGESTNTGEPIRFAGVKVTRLR